MLYQTGEYSNEVFSRIPHADDAFTYIDEHPLPPTAIDELRYFPRFGAPSQVC